MAEEKLLRDYNDDEKGAYISAIASLATADRTASGEEHEFLQAIADSAELSAEQVDKVNAAADDTTGQQLTSSLDTLKNSELRFSLLTDLVAFAESDNNYSEEEKTNIRKMAEYLNITPEQVSTINQFVHKASESNITPEQAREPGFLNALGMEDKFRSAGINIGSITKGLLAIAGPMILQRMLSRRGMNSGGGLGGILGGILGGGGGMRGGGTGSGGLGSLISILSGGRGIGGAGGMLGKILKGS